MADNRNDEPIIATRPTREPPRDDAPPLWRLVLLLGIGLAIVFWIAWWWTERSSSDDGSAAAEPETPALEAQPPIPVEQEPIAPTLDLDERADAAPDTDADIEQAPSAPAVAQESAADAQPAESATDVEQATGAEPAAEGEPPAESEVPAAPESSPETDIEPAPPAPVSLRFTSPDPQVQIELHGPQDSPPVTSKVGEVVTVAPGTYRVVASGPQLETFEQEVALEGEGPLEYTVELCAERKYDRRSLAGQVVEERVCASTAECESLFLILSEYADQLLHSRDFRSQQCARWRPEAAPEGKWTLDIQCGGPTETTTCRIEIAEGTCTFAQPRRSLRGTACPRAELK